MSNNTRESRAPVWDADIRRLAANIDDVIEIGAKNESLLHVTQTDEHKHFIQQMRYAPEDVTDEQLRGLGTYVYWHLKHDLELKWKDDQGQDLDQGQDSDPEPTPKKPVTRRQTRSTTKSVIEHALSPKNQLETIADNVEMLQKALGGVLESRFNLLLEEWESAKPDSDGFKDGTTPAKKGISKTKKTRENQVITTHHLRFAAFFYEVGPEILKKITKRSKNRGNTDGIDRIAKFMVEQFDKVATGMKSIFDALDDYDLDYKGAIAGSSYGVIIPCSLKSDPNEDNVVAVVKNFLTEVDVVKGKKVDQSITDINNEISLMHKVAHGEGSEFFIKPLDWNVDPIAPFLVMEPIHGGNLEDFIEDLTIEKRLKLLPRFAKTLAAGVQTLHGNGIIHRDIKLGNLMLRDAGDIGSLVVADLGLGTKVKVDETGFPTERCGTLEFMAPESWLEDRIKTYKVDLFSCGMTLLHFLVGAENFKDIANGRTRNKVTGAFFTREKLEEELDLIIYVPPQMINLLDGLTKPDPNERLSVEEWLHHPALRDVPNPLEVADDIPAGDAPPQDNIEQLTENLEAANQRAAEAEEKIAGLKTENAKVEEKLDAANEEAANAKEQIAQLKAELSELKKNGGTGTSLETQLAGMQLESAGSQSLPASFTNPGTAFSAEAYSALVAENDSLRNTILMTEQPLDHKIILNLANDSAFVESFVRELSGTDVRPGLRGKKRGSLLAFATGINDVWKKHQIAAENDGTWPGLPTFLVNLPTHLTPLSNALKKTASVGKHYHAKDTTHTTVSLALPKKEEETKRKGDWLEEARMVSADICAKVSGPEISNDRNFTSVLVKIKKAVNEVFDSDKYRTSHGFGLITESSRHSLAILFAIIHVNAGKAWT